MAPSFDQQLTRSQHFADVINTHRTATAQILAAFIGPLVKSGTMEPAQVAAILKSLEAGTRHPSLDGERRHAVSVIRELLSQSR